MLTQQRHEIQAAWDAIAPGYDRFVTATDDWALPQDALRRAGLRAGQRVLDVASGSGALSVPAARAGAEVLAADISPAMIERLEARARSEGLANVQGRVMDGHALDLEDSMFDLVASQFGVMLFPDLPRGLAEMVRVVRPGGCVLVVAYGPPAQVEFLQVFLGALQREVPAFAPPPMDPPPLPFQVADPAVLRRRMEEAGLRNVRVEPGMERFRFASGREMWDWVTNSNPIGAMLVADLSEEQGAAVRQDLDDRLRERAQGNGPAVLVAPVNIGIGTRAQ